MGRPFVKRFVLCYSCLFCLSVTLVYCDQAVGWTKVKHGMEVGLNPGHIVLDGNPAPPKEKGTAASTFLPIFIVAKRSPISAPASSCHVTNERRDCCCSQHDSRQPASTIGRQQRRSKHNDHLSSTAAVVVERAACVHRL